MDRILSTKHEWDPHTHFRACHEISNKLQHEVVGTSKQIFLENIKYTYASIYYAEKVFRCKFLTQNCENKTKSEMSVF